MDELILAFGHFEAFIILLSLWLDHSYSSQSSFFLFKFLFAWSPVHWFLTQMCLSRLFPFRSRVMTNLGNLDFLCILGYFQERAYYWQLFLDNRHKLGPGKRGLWSSQALPMFACKTLITNGNKKILFPQCLSTCNLVNCLCIHLE